MLQRRSRSPRDAGYHSTGDVCSNHTTLTGLHNCNDSCKNQRCIYILGCIHTALSGFVFLQRPWVFRRSFEPLVIPFKEELKWWSSVELGRRIIIVLFIVSFPHNQVKWSAKNDPY